MTELEKMRIDLSRAMARLPQSKFCDWLTLGVEDDKLRVDASKTLKAFLYIDPELVRQEENLDELAGDIREFLEDRLISEMELPSAMLCGER